MTDVELVIKIPEGLVCDGFERPFTEEEKNILIKAIGNGTSLPKGHGRLGDLDKIWNKLKELEEYYQAEFLKESNAIHESAMNGRLYGFTNSKFIVQDAPTIIEAEKE